MTFNQGEFDFGGSRPESGYLNWLDAIRERKRAFESRWGVALDRRVRVDLVGYDRSVEGIISLACPESHAFSKNLKLRIGKFEFFPDDIENLVRID